LNKKWMIGSIFCLVLISWVEFWALTPTSRFGIKYSAGDSVVVEGTLRVVADSLFYGDRKVGTIAWQDSVKVEVDSLIAKTGHIDAFTSATSRIASMSIDSAAYLQEDRVIHHPFQLVDKAYVDQAVGALGARWYMLDSLDVATGYRVARMSTPGGATADSLTASALADSGLVATWISAEGASPAVLLGGIYQLVVFAKRVGGHGSRTLRLYWELIERKADTSEHVIESSVYSNTLLEGVTQQVEVGILLPSDFTPEVGSRVIGRIRARVYGATGAAPDMRLFFEGDYNSRWELPTNTEYITDNFVPYTGAYTDVDLGAQSLMADSLIANAAVRVSVEDEPDLVVLQKYSSAAQTAGAKINFLHAKGTKDSPDTTLRATQLGTLTGTAFVRNAGNSANAEVAMADYQLYLLSKDAEGRGTGAHRWRTSVASGGLSLRMQLDAAGHLTPGVNKTQNFGSATTSWDTTFSKVAVADSAAIPRLKGKVSFADSVALGTTTPVERLQVKGNIRLDDEGNTIELRTSSSTVQGRLFTGDNVSTNSAFYTTGNSLVLGFDGVGGGTTARQFYIGKGSYDGASPWVTYFNINNDGHVLAGANKTQNLGLAATSWDTTFTKVVVADSAVVASKLTVGTSTTATSQIGFTSTSNTAASSALLSLARSRGSGPGLDETQSGDYLGQFITGGVNSSSTLVNAAMIRFIQDGAAGAAYVPAKIILRTSDGSTSANDRLTIDPTGHTYPGANKTQNLGSATTSWDTTFTKLTIVEADMPFFDDRDDIALIRAIRGSGKFNPRGYEIVDDLTMPDEIMVLHQRDWNDTTITVLETRIDTVQVDTVWVDQPPLQEFRTVIDDDGIESEEIFYSEVPPMPEPKFTVETVVVRSDTTVVEHKKGNWITDSEGTPYFDVTSAIGLGYGAIRQMASKLDTLQIIADTTLTAGQLHLRMSEVESRITALEEALEATEEQVSNLQLIIIGLAALNGVILVFKRGKKGKDILEENHAELDQR